MAKVTKGNSIDMRTLNSEPVYRLELSKDEAEAILILTGKVNGSDSRSPRKHTKAVFHALRDADVAWIGSESHRLAHGNISFDQYPDPKPAAAPEPVFKPGHFRLKADHDTLRYFATSPSNAWERVQIAGPGDMVFPLPEIRFDSPFTRGYLGRGF